MVSFGEFYSTSELLLPMLSLEGSIGNTAHRRSGIQDIMKQSVSEQGSSASGDVQLVNR